MDMLNISVKLVTLNAYKVSVTYCCHRFCSETHYGSGFSLAAETSLVKAEVINVYTRIFPQVSSFGHRTAEVIQQKMAQRATKCLQLPI